MEKRNDIAQYVHNVYIQLLILCFIIFALAISCLFLKIGINTFIIPIAYLISICLGFVMIKKRDVRQFLIIEVIVLTIIIITLILTGNFYDISWDGMWYHQNAIIELNNGWNPIYEKLTGEGALWNNYYGKYSEIMQACILSTFKNIEMGKMINVLFMIMATLYSLYILLLRFKFNYAHSLVYALLIGFNPVSIYQMLSFYHDGILASLLIICGCMILDLEKDDSTIKYIFLVMIGCIGVNIKFTLLGYVFAIGGMYILYRLINKRNIKKLIISASMILVIGVGILGFNPYMINLQEGNHIFYPLMGQGKVDIISYNQPKSFAEKNWIEKFMTSIFSESDNINEVAKGDPAIKVPLYINEEEINVFKMPDVRIGGWGPLFSGMLILSIIIYIRQKYEKKSISLFLLGILITVIMNPEAWWARYTPQLYLIPIIVFSTFSLDIQEKKEYGRRGIFCKIIELAVVLICALNITFVAYSYFKANVQSTKTINNQLIALKDSNIEVYIKSDKFKSSCLKRLDDKHISYKIVKNMDNEKTWTSFSTSRNTIYFTKVN
ncbi:hypothetical protein DIC82_02505 [Clostridium beijerinckii]|nr:hypothetical protein DIC82_02505 [Clostridium beijerinckii]